MARPSFLQLTISSIQLTLFVFFGIFSVPVVLLADETIQPKPYYRTQLLSGFTKARQTVRVSSEVAGKCIAFSAEIGAALPESGVLAEIDDTFINLDMQTNRLEIESIRRQLLTEKKMLGRYTTLIDKNSATQAKLDEVKLNVDLNEMKLKSLNTQYRRLHENLARHTITAPKDWILVKQMIEPGEYVVPGQAIASIGDFSQLLIPLALNYNELKMLRLKETIPLYFPDLELKTTAKIYRVSPAFTEATKKIAVDLLVENKDQLNSVRGGLRGEIYLQQQKEETFVLPISAVINRYDAHWVVKENRDRIRVLFLGTTDKGASAIISSGDLTLQDRIYATIPDFFSSAQMID